MLTVRFVALIGLLALSFHASAAPYSSMYVFGDSGSDNGRRLALQGIPQAPYYQGRHSNGPVAVEIFASNLGLNTPATLTDYAVGGALSGHGNGDPNPLLANTGLLDQFQTFNQGYASADPYALYFIWGGDVDINQCKGLSGGDCSTAQINGVVQNLNLLIGNLSGLGAKHFFVVGPYGGGSSKQSFRDILAPNLIAEAALLQVDILYFDASQVLLNMITPGNPYGFTQASPCYTGNFKGVGGTLCSDPDSYVVWDTTGHLTAAAHTILGNAMSAAAVPEPETYAMLFAGLGLVVWTVRRRKQDEV